MQVILDLLALPMCLEKPALNLEDLAKPAKFDFYF